MGGKDIFSLIFILIFLFLILNNGTQTNTVIGSLSSGFNSAVSTLQGRGSTGINPAGVGSTAGLTAV